MGPGPWTLGLILPRRVWRESGSPGHQGCWVRSEHVRPSLCGAGGLLEISEESPASSPRASEAPSPPGPQGLGVWGGQRGYHLLCLLISCCISPSVFISLALYLWVILTLHVRMSLSSSDSLSFSVSESQFLSALSPSASLSLSPSPCLSCFLCVVCLSPVPLSVCCLLHSGTPMLPGGLY